VLAQGRAGHARYTRDMEAALSIAMRWLHIASAVVLLGSVFYARMAIGEMAQSFKPWVYAAIGGLLASGIYNFLSKLPISTNYKLWFSIKMLLALHVFASAILYRGKRRSLTGMVIAGALILLISGYLRWISQAI
jgi:flagellar biosynthesis protein FliQ